MALRALSVRTGLFTESEKGRQQLVIKRSIGEWILKYGYCIFREEMTVEDHPEQGSASFHPIEGQDQVRPVRHELLSKVPGEDCQGKASLE